MKISILTFNLSSNSLGRAYILAKVLQRKYDVEIVGFMQGEDIWKPLNNEKDIFYKFVKFNGKSISINKIKELYNKINGDIVLLAKPIFHCFIIGISQKLFRKKPLILDIDDWQMGFLLDFFFTRNKSLIKRIIFLLKDPIRFVLNPNKSFLWSIVIEKMTRLADQIIVSNNFLKKRFGGTLVYHGRDIEKLNPEKYNKQELRYKYRLVNDMKIIMFFGTVRLHKGIRILIEAIKLIKRKNVIFVMVGVDFKKTYCKDLIRYGKEELFDRFIIYGVQPFEKVAEFISIADVIVIPQLNSYSSIGQIPAKIFDAMAMAKPIISTNVSDIPFVLKDCGWIVGPDNPWLLADAIRNVLDNQKKARIVGLKARNRCIKKFSWDVMEKTLVDIFEHYNISSKVKNNKF